MTPRYQQKGIAVITALVIFAIAVILATDRYWYTAIDTRRTSNLLGAEQAYAYILGAEDWVSHILRRDDRDQDSRLDAWSTDAVILPVDGGQITGLITDEQSLFNINNVVDHQGTIDLAWLERLRRLLVVLEQDPILADRIADWIDNDIEPIGFNGAEDDYYLRKSPAYRTPNRPLTSISELRLVEGMTPDTYAVVAPFLTALPGNTSININFARPEILLAIGNEITDSDIARIEEARDSGLFDSTESLLTFMQGLQGDFDEQILSVSSNYFLLQTRVAVGSAAMTIYSILHRDPLSGATHVLQRSAGLR